MDTIYSNIQLNTRNLAVGPPLHWRESCASCDGGDDGACAFCAGASCERCRACERQQKHSDDLEQGKVAHMYNKPSLSLLSLSPLPLCLDFVELQSIWLLRAFLSLSHFIYLSSEAAMNHKVSKLTKPSTTLFQGKRATYTCVSTMSGTQPTT